MLSHFSDSPAGIRAPPSAADRHVDHYSADTDEKPHGHVLIKEKNVRHRSLSAVGEGGGEQAGYSSCGSIKHVKDEQQGQDLTSYLNKYRDLL